MADDFHAPSHSVWIDGQEIFGEISNAIQSVEYESIDGIADLAKITVANPDLTLTDSKLFSIGNRLDVFIGYSNRREHIGTVDIVRPEFDFPSKGMPKIMLKGYSADHRMMDAKAPKASERRPPGAKATPNKGAWSKTPIHAIVQEKADAYGFSADIDPVDGPPKSVIQKSTMSDYDLVRGLSNFTGYLFWVDSDSAGNWTLHFKRPGANPGNQSKRYTFKYNAGDATTIFGFQPRYLLKGPSSKLRCEYYDPHKGKTTTVEITDEDSPTDTKYRGDPSEELEQSLKGPGTVKLFLGEFSLDVVTHKRLKTPGDLKRWAEQWFRRNRESFVIGKGRLIGVESLKARQTHVLEGLGKALSGEWYFTRVRHMSGKDGYWCDFTAHKVI